MNCREILVNKMTSNTIVKVFLCKISQKVSETNKKKQILDDVKNTYNHDENANYAVTLICGYVIYVYMIVKYMLPGKFTFSIQSYILYPAENLIIIFGCSQNRSLCKIPQFH